MEDQPAPGLLSVWTVYDHPADFPNEYVARRFDVVPGSIEPMWTAALERSPLLGEIRARMEARGLFCIKRLPADDPKIIEVWL